MDYSSFYPSVLLMYFGSFAGVLAAISFFVYGSVKLFKEYLKSKDRIEIVGVVACIAFVIIIANDSQIFFKDIPNVLNENYIITTKTVQVGNSGGQSPETRSFTLKKGDGEIVKICVVYYSIEQGDRFEAIYLPITKYGVIVKN